MHAHGSARSSESSGPQAPYVVTYDVATEALTAAIADALAATTGLGRAEVAARFPDHVDPDALNDLFRVPADGGPCFGGPLKLTVAGHQVYAYSDGHLVVYPTD